MAQINIQNTSGSFNATAANNEYILAIGKTITATGGLTALDAGGGASGRSLYLFGSISAEESSGIVVGDYSTHLGKADTFVIGATATVSGYSGVTLYADGQWATNQGMIEGKKSSGFYASADEVRFTNTGTVTGKLYGIDMTGDGNVVINQGTISGDKALSLEGATANLSNDGTIEGTALAIDATGISGGIVVSNRGTINGNVTFGAGADVFQNDGGTMNGIVRGGEGDDLYYVDQIGLDIRERGGEGSDYVYASLDWRLGKNFETLVLYGSGNLDGTGNALDNRLMGNAENNRLSGGDGRDELAGNGGRDVLEGGAGADTFLFETGNGHDRILDFGVGKDRIELDEFDAITSFTDLMKNHLTVKGDNLLISAGDDVLTLVDVSRAELDKADFIF